MIPLSLLLLVAIYVMVERFLTISKLRKNATLLASIKKMKNNGNLSNARNFVKVLILRSINEEQGISPNWTTNSGIR